MKSLNIYFTRTYAAITIITDDGVRREVGASDIVAVIQSMDADDQVMLRNFCISVQDCIEGDCRKLKEW